MGRVSNIPIWKTLASTPIGIFAWGIPLKLPLQRWPAKMFARETGKHTLFCRVANVALTI